MKQTIFRTYDLRGRVGEEFNLDETYALGAAIAHYYRENGVAQVVIGRDGRMSSLRIAHDLIRALRAAGIFIIDIGLVPTPVLSYCTEHLGADGGVMVTASHNGPEYNGIKLTLNHDPVWGDQIVDIKNRYYARVESIAEHPGSYALCDGAALYCAMLGERFAHLRGISFPAVVDCSSGTAAVIVPRLITQLEIRDIVCINSVVDGAFPAHKPDPTVHAHMEHCAQLVRERKAICGIGFDGDADRMAVLSASGRLMTGDELLVFFAESSQSSQGPIIADLKCSDILLDYLAERGARVIRSASGHSIIRAALRREKGILAGELSCHFFFPAEYYPFDDGIYAFFRFMSSIVARTETIDQFLARLPQRYPLPEERIPVDDVRKGRVVEWCRQHIAAQPDWGELAALDGVRCSNRDGWFLIRQSNTEPAITISLEGRSAAARDVLRAMVATVLLRAFEETLVL
jgi:phosphomannomutase